MNEFCNVVELEQVHKHYRDLHALKGISFSIKAGEIFGLFGHNGAGKTTTIKSILGLLSLSSGSIRLFGHDPSRSRNYSARNYIGFLQENVTFYEQLTGLEVLYYFGRLKNITKKTCHDLLIQVGLSHAEHRRVKTYSKGMRQRLGLAQALLGTPQLLLLDEPTVGLDPIATKDFYQTLLLLKARGCSIILSSHILPGVEKYIDKAVILGRGTVLTSGSLLQMREEANLPVRIVLDGQITLPSHLIDLSTNDHVRTELLVPISRKLEVLEEVVRLKGLQNIDIQMPTLEDVYSHFTSSISLGL